MQRAWRRTAGAGTLGNLPTRSQRVASFLLVRATSDGRGATGSPRQCSSSRAVLAGQQQEQQRWRPAVAAARLCTSSPQTTKTRLLAVDNNEKKATNVPRIAYSNNVTLAPARSAVPRTRDKNMYSAPLVVCQQPLRGPPSGVVWRCSGLPSATFWKRFLSYTGRSFSSNDNHNHKNQNPNSSSCNTHNNCHAGPKQQSTAQPTPTSTTTPWLSTVTTTSDPPVWTWVERVLPLYWQPYARLARFDKPIGTMLLLWPCFWSTAIAAEAGALPDGHLLALFTVGAVTMRGAGCTINDWWDQDLDRSVARTATRPLAAGDVSVREAVAFLAFQLSVGLAVLLSLPHTWYCVQWGCLSLPLVALYPATKRFFPYPQAVLGLTFNWGAIMGFAAVHGYVDYTIVAPLYLSGVTWTLVYDTLYAHQDKHDDAKLNLQSTALTFGESEARQRNILHGLGLTTWVAWLMAGYQADLALVPFFVGATAAYGHLRWQINSADFNNPHNLAERFRSNNTVGAILFAALVTGKYFAV